MLDLTNDCFRFVMGYFEVINSSAPHIYHSALAFAPENSIVRKLYESHAQPFIRVVRGLPVSWDTNTAATTRPYDIERAVWSPCNRFIAITWEDATIEVLDPVTLRRLQTLEFPPGLDSDTDIRALVFSPDSRILTCFQNGFLGQKLLVVSWDLQTGGVTSVINPRWRRIFEDIDGTPSITYSENGKMVAVRVWYLNDNHIFIFDVASGAYIRSHSPTNVIAHTNGIWAHGESFRFTTVHRTAITIWEVGFTRDSTPTRVKTFFPFPGRHFRSRLEVETQEEAQFLPSESRLALVSEDKVAVWDTHNSKCLLYCADTRFYPRMSFSSDGRFFACSTTGTDVYVWKESPTGYILHQILTSNTTRSRPLLSTHGESIIVLGGSAIRLWHTKVLTTPPSSGSTRTPQLARNFVADFSPDGMLVALARLGGGVVTILDLKSGFPQLTISAKMNVYGLRVIGDTITVVGAGKVVTWDLPVGGQVPNAKVTLKDSTRTINLSDPPKKVVSAAISPLSSPIALVEYAELGLYNVYFYNGSTGEELTDTTVSFNDLWFAPGGRDLWLGDADTLRESDGWKWQVDGERVNDEDPPEGYPWASSHGYRITEDWWILGPGGKRLLVLPPSWQSHKAALRAWKGNFVVLLQGGLPEPVILDLDP